MPWRLMAERREPQALGAILAGTMIAGTVGGVIVGQSSAGFLIGVAAGLVVLGLHWLRQRRR